MCGIFGYFGKVPCSDKIQQVARLASERGPDGYGYSVDGKTVRALGALKNEIPEGKTVIGHFRLHTVINSAREESLLHPFEVGKTIIVHNGAIADYPNVYRSDSDYLAHVLEYKGFMGLFSVLGDERAAIAGVRKGVPFLYSNGIPLFCSNIEKSDYSNGLYFCSKRFEGSRPLQGIMILK